MRSSTTPFKPLQIHDPVQLATMTYAQVGKPWKCTRTKRWGWAFNGGYDGKLTNRRKVSVKCPFKKDGKCCKNFWGTKDPNNCDYHVTDVDWCGGQCHSSGKGCRGPPNLVQYLKDLVAGGKQTVTAVEKGGSKLVAEGKKTATDTVKVVTKKVQQTVAKVADVVIDLQVQQKLCEHKADIDSSTIDLLLKKGKKTGALQQSAQKYGLPASEVIQFAKQIDAYVQPPNASTMTFNGMNKAGKAVGLPDVGTKAHAKFQGVQKTVFDTHNKVYKLVGVKKLKNPGLTMKDTVDDMCFNIQKHFNLIKGAQPACTEVKGCCKKVVAPPLPYRTKRVRGGFCCPKGKNNCNQ